MAPVTHRHCDGLLIIDEFLENRERIIKSTRWKWFEQCWKVSVICIERQVLRPVELGRWKPPGGMVFISENRTNDQFETGSIFKDNREIFTLASIYYNQYASQGLHPHNDIGHNSCVKAESWTAMQRPTRWSVIGCCAVFRSRQKRSMPASSRRLT